MVTIPMAFWASLEPCDKAIALAETSCARRKKWLTFEGPVRRKIHSNSTISTRPISRPAIGDSTSPFRTLPTPLDCTRPAKVSPAAAPALPAPSGPGERVEQSRWLLLPVSVLAGRDEYMSWIAEGRTVHAGTLNGNPLGLAATVATLHALTPSVYEQLDRLGRQLRAGLEEALRAKGIDVVTTGEGAVFQVHFQPEVPREYRDTLPTDKALYAAFLMALLDAGVLALPDGRVLAATDQELIFINPS